MNKIKEAFKASAQSNGPPPTESLISDVLEADLMAKVVEEVIAYAKVKNKEVELPMFLSTLEIIQKSFSVSELSSLKAQFERNPECKVIPRDHMIPVNVALQLIDERIKHLKRELLEELDNGGETLLLTEMWGDIMKQLKPEIAARIQSIRQSTSPTSPSASTASTASTAASPTASTDSDTTLANAPLSKQELASVLYRCLTDPALMAKTAAFLDPKADEDSKKAEAEAAKTNAAAIAAKKDQKSVTDSPAKSDPTAAASSMAVRPSLMFDGPPTANAAGTGIPALKIEGGLPSLPELPTLSVSVVLAAQQSLLALNAAQQSASALSAVPETSAAPPEAPSAPSAPPPPPPPMDIPAELPAASQPKKLSIHSFKKGPAHKKKDPNAINPADFKAGGGAGGTAKESVKIAATPSLKRNCESSPPDNRRLDCCICACTCFGCAVAPNLMDILKSRMKDVRLQVEPEGYNTMQFANGTLDWSTIKPAGKAAAKEIAKAKVNRADIIAAANAALKEGDASK